MNFFKKNQLKKETKKQKKSSQLGLTYQNCNLNHLTGITP
jgi:hypothetical protein